MILVPKRRKVSGRFLRKKKLRVIICTEGNVTAVVETGRSFLPICMKEKNVYELLLGKSLIKR
jgi:hypothetical protein